MNIPMPIQPSPSRVPSLPNLAAIFFLCLTAGGCLITSNASEHRSGTYVSDTTFNQIQPGKTTEGWIDATLGKPTSVSRLDDGTEIWKYSYTERRDSSGAVFLIFGGSNSTETNHTAFVEIHDGIVRKAWRG
jgi:outer membrane protein assembly factor BamE (lipoprotein component of BamABCDE complex)